MSEPLLQKEAAEFVARLSSLAEEAATTSEGARTFIALVEAAKKQPPESTRRLREFCDCLARDLRGVA